MPGKYSETELSNIAEWMKQQTPVKDISERLNRPARGIGLRVKTVLRDTPDLKPFRDFYAREIINITTEYQRQHNMEKQHNIEKPFTEKFVIPFGEKERLHVYLPTGPFDKGIAALRKESLELITACDLAKARIFDYPVSREWTWVAENFNYFPNGDIVIASRDYSPLLRKGAPEDATKCHRYGNEFYLDGSIAKDLRERAEADPEKAMKSGVLLLPRTRFNVSLIPSTALKDEPLTHFLFRDAAKGYGYFLKDAGVDSVPVHVEIVEYAKNQKQAFSRALRVGNILALSGRSGLYCNDHYLNNSDGRVYQACRSPLEQRASK